MEVATAAGNFAAGTCFRFIEIRRVSVDPEMHFTWFALDACIRMCYGVAKELLLVNGLFDICPGRCGESWCGDGANGCKHGVVDSTSAIEEGTDDFLGKLDLCRILGTRIIPPRITCTLSHIIRTVPCYRRLHQPPLNFATNLHTTTLTDPLSFLQSPHSIAPLPHSQIIHEHFQLPIRPRTSTQSLTHQATTNLALMLM